MSLLYISNDTSPGFRRGFVKDESWITLEPSQLFNRLGKEGDQRKALRRDRRCKPIHLPKHAMHAYARRSDAIELHLDVRDVLRATLTVSIKMNP